MFLFLSQASIIHKVITSYFKDTFDWFSDVTCLCFLSRRYISFSKSTTGMCNNAHCYKSFLSNKAHCSKSFLRNNVLMYFRCHITYINVQIFRFLLKWIGKKCVCQLKHFSYNELDLCQLLSISLFKNWVWQHLN